DCIRVATVTGVQTCALPIYEQSVSASVVTYIQFKVDWLSKRNKYSSDTRDAVQSYLSQNAKGTFLWVALVCEELSNTSGWKAQRSEERRVGKEYKLNMITDG